MERRDAELEARRKQRAHERAVRKSDQQLSGWPNLRYLEEEVAEDRRQLAECEKERRRWEEFLLDDLRRLWRYVAFLRRRW